MRFSARKVSVERAPPATDVQLELVHIESYIAAVRLAGRPDPASSIPGFGLGTGDDPVFPGMHDASPGRDGAAAGGRGCCGRR